MSKWQTEIHYMTTSVMYQNKYIVNLPFHKVKFISLYLFLVQKRTCYIYIMLDCVCYTQKFQAVWKGMARNCFC